MPSSTGRFLPALLLASTGIAQNFFSGLPSTDDTGSLEKDTLPEDLLEPTDRYTFFNCQTRTLADGSHRPGCNAYSVKTTELLGDDQKPGRLEVLTTVGSDDLPNHYLMRATWDQGYFQANGFVDQTFTFSSATNHKPRVFNFPENWNIDESTGLLWDDYQLRFFWMFITKSSRHAADGSPGVSIPSWNRDDNPEDIVEEYLNVVEMLKGQFNTAEADGSGAYYLTFQRTADTADGTDFATRNPVMVAFNGAKMVWPFATNALPIVYTNPDIFKPRRTDLDTDPMWHMITSSWPVPTDGCTAQDNHESCDTWDYSIPMVGFTDSDASRENNGFALRPTATKTVLTPYTCESNGTAPTAETGDRAYTMADYVTRGSFLSYHKRPADPDPYSIFSHRTLAGQLDMGARTLDLTGWFTNTFGSGDFPNVWKIAQVEPVDNKTVSDCATLDDCLASIQTWIDGKVGTEFVFPITVELNMRGWDTIGGPLYGVNNLGVSEINTKLKELQSTTVSRLVQYSDVFCEGRTKWSEVPMSQLAGKIIVLYRLEEKNLDPDLMSAKRACDYCVAQGKTFVYGVYCNVTCVATCPNGTAEAECVSNSTGSCPASGSDFVPCNAEAGNPTVPTERPTTAEVDAFETNDDTSIGLAVTITFAGSALTIILGSLLHMFFFGDGPFLYYAPTSEVNAVLGPGSRSKLPGGGGTTGTTNGDPPQGETELPTYRSAASMSIIRDVQAQGQGEGEAGGS